MTSDAVFVELLLGVPHKGRKIIDLIAGLPRLDETPEIRELAQHYIEQKLMPRGLFGDAMHLALASWHRCHFLMTWNCMHLANANKARHIEVINRRRSLPTPVIVTPLELLNLSDHV